MPHDRHRQQLDSLRTFAVLAVIAGHLAPRVTEPLPLGDLGVRLFFVLSGFLITGILLECRALVAEGAAPGAVVGRFYARRAIRILPAFYGLMAIMWIAGIPELRAGWPWHVAYASNVYFVRMNDWSGVTGPFWSLAVEEQFYLVWPMIILFLPLRRMTLLLIGVAAIAPIYRLLCIWNDWSVMAMQTLPFGSADSLALGALLAWLSKTDDRGRRRLSSTGALTMPLALVLTALAAVQVTSAAALRAIVFDSAWSLAFVWLLDGAARGFAGMPGRILDNAALRYVGRISYAIYLIHALSPFIIRWLWVENLGQPPLSPLIGVAAAVAVTIALASLSWRFFEGPINGLKRYIPYDPRPAKASAALG
jgi:peptidoglycan/LPS O-acetylase OafA/YrhL